MIINYFCDHCYKKLSRVYDSSKDIQAEVSCNVCGLNAIRSLGCPTSNTVEVVDNGFMSQSVEYDAQRAYHLRQVSKQHSYEALNPTDKKL